MSYSTKDGATSASQATLAPDLCEKGPKLQTKLPPAEPDIYDRFTPRQKTQIVAIVSYTAFIGRA